MGDEKSIFQQVCLDSDFEMESNEDIDCVTDLDIEQMASSQPDQSVTPQIGIKKSMSFLQNNLSQSHRDN